MNVGLEELQHYIDLKMDIIPCHFWNKKIKRNGKTIERGKTPLLKKWTTLDKDLEKSVALIRQGHNAGLRLNANDLIIDIDPRNYKEGVNSLELLENDIGVELIDTYPTVLTGGGGFHFYCKKPASFEIRHVLDEYPGIEFKSKGSQVLCAGSKHPSGNYYTFDEFSPELDQRTLAPKKLLKLLRYDAVSVSVETGELTNEELARLLFQLDPKDFNSNETWEPIAMAAHHATNGEGLEEFLSWSTSDLNYENDEHVIKCRWDSFRSNKNTQITVNTLRKTVLTYGGTTNVSDCREDFAEYTDAHENFTDIPSVDDEFADIIDDGGELTEGFIEGAAVALAEKIDTDSSNELIRQAVRSALQAGMMEQFRAMDIIRKSLKISKGQLNELVKLVKDQLIDDMGRTLANKTIELVFKNGNGIVYSANEQFWIYNNRFWEPVTSKYIQGKVIKVLDKMRIAIDGLSVKESALVSEASNLLGALTATRGDALGLTKKRLPIVNCLNGEIWMEKEGASNLKKHSYKSYQTQVLDVRFDPGADCPLFDKTIREIFDNYIDCDEMVRHFEEFMGYSIQPHKDIATWWLLKGPGGDGKSTLMSVLCALLGESVLAESIQRFKVGGAGSDNHIMDRLVGKLLIYDDDMNKADEIPNGPIKKLSENKPLNSNPKGAKSFNFINCACPVMLSNGYPRTRDISEGIRRRANVIPFNRSFDSHGIAKLGLADQITENELSGVLNRALAGYLRLRKRGKFKKPKSCVIAEQEWLRSSNTLFLFVSERLEHSEDSADSITLIDVYDEYLDWCSNNGIRQKGTKNQFKLDLEDLNYKVEILKGNRRGYRHLKLKPPEKLETDMFDEFD